MVYDRSRNLLFIHIPKNAGKSIALSLGLTTLEDEKKRSVKVKVAAGTPAGVFWLQATPTTKCECKGPGNIVRDCSDQNERVNINVTA